MESMRFLLLLAVVTSTSSALAQEDLGAVLEKRAGSVPDGPRAFQETWLLPAEAPTATDPANTRFAGRVHVYQQAPKERLEIHRVVDGELADPVVVVLDGNRYLLVTPVGATPFLESDPAQDPFIRMILAGPPGPAPPHRTVPAAGGFAAVVLRHGEAGAFDTKKAFATELPRGGAGLLSGLSSFSAAGETEVVASAGARGVDRIRTATGTITVVPDEQAVEWMESTTRVPVAELERFRREARLAPYHLLPAVPSPAAEEEAG